MPPVPTKNAARPKRKRDLSDENSRPRTVDSQGNTSNATGQQLANSSYAEIMQASSFTTPQMLSGEGPINGSPPVQSSIVRRTTPNQSNPRIPGHLDPSSKSFNPYAAILKHREQDMRQPSAQASQIRSSNRPQTASTSPGQGEPVHRNISIALNTQNNRPDSPEKEPLRLTASKVHAWQQNVYDQLRQSQSINQRPPETPAVATAQTLQQPFGQGVPNISQPPGQFSGSPLVNPGIPGPSHPMHELPRQHRFHFSNGQAEQNDPPQPLFFAQLQAMNVPQPRYTGPNSNIHSGRTTPTVSYTDEGSDPDPDLTPTWEEGKPYVEYILNIPPEGPNRALATKNTHAAVFSLATQYPEKIGFLNYNLSPAQIVL